MTFDVDEMLRRIPVSAEFPNLVSTCDRLLEQGNIPDLKAQLGSHYPDVRLALLIVNQFMSCREMAQRIAADFAASLDPGSKRYQELLLYERFYKTWCGVHAVGAWCGFPYDTEENLMRVREEIAALNGDRHETT